MREGLSAEKLKGIYRRIAKRYDWQHTLLTVRSDQKGRKLLVDEAVSEGDKVLDCGAGTGTTGIMAAKKVGPSGRVTMYDLSDAMLERARVKVSRELVRSRVTFQTGDIMQLPFADSTFDVVISTYSLCPVYDPVKGALEMYRVTRPGGKIAVAHSTEPNNLYVKWLADRIENVVWRLPWLSMGCRSIEVLPALKKAGGEPIFSKIIGVPLWPFFVFVVRKPLSM